MFTDNVFHLPYRIQFPSCFGSFQACCLRAQTSLLTAKQIAPRLATARTVKIVQIVGIVQVVPTVQGEFRLDHKTRTSASQWFETGG